MDIKDSLQTWKNRRKHRLTQTVERFAAWGVKSAERALIMAAAGLIGGGYIYSVITGVEMRDAVVRNIPTTLNLNFTTLIFDILVLGFLSGGLVWTWKIGKDGRYEQVAYVLMGLGSLLAFAVLTGIISLPFI